MEYLLRNMERQAAAHGTTLPARYAGLLGVIAFGALTTVYFLMVFNLY